MAAAQIKPGTSDLVAAAGNVLAKDADASVRQTAAALLVEAGAAARPILPAAHTALSDSDPMVRVYAAAIVGHLGETAIAVPVLLDGMQSQDGAIRAEAAGLIAEMAPTDKRVMPALVEGLHDEDRRV